MFNVLIISLLAGTILGIVYGWLFSRRIKNAFLPSTGTSDIVQTRPKNRILRTLFSSFITSYLLMTVLVITIIKTCSIDPMPYGVAFSTSFGIMVLRLVRIIS